MPEFEESTPPGAHGTEGRPRHRKNKETMDQSEKGRGGSSQTNSQSENSRNSSATYSDEQTDAVERIRQCKNYYEILGVSQDCSDDDLKRAYKKLALKFHPDKNHAPGATEAFTAIGNAFAVLSEPSKRQRYDQFGSEEEQTVAAPQRFRQHNGYYEYDFSRGFEGDISAEELFNIFFGNSAFQTPGSMRGGARVFHRPASTRTQFTTHYRQHQQQHGQHHQSNDSSYAVLVQLGPILFLVLISVLTAFMSGDPTYSSKATQKYNTARKTSNLDITYYVKSDFTTTFKGNLNKLESQVEEDYLSNLRSSCYRERMYRENLMWQARSYRNSRMYEEAQNTKMPSCELLQSLHDVYAT